MSLKKLYILPILIFTLLYTQNLQAGLFDKNRNKKDVEIIKNIEYGSHERQKLDLYLPQNTNSSRLPVLMFIHGGAWQKGDKDMYDKMGIFYAENDILFIAINYRLSPDYVHPALAEDCAHAVSWIYQNIDKYGGNTNKITLSGHSAGAHLSALISTDKRYLDAYGLPTSIFKTVIPNDTASFDFLLPIKKGKRIVQPIIDYTFGTDEKGLADASPITHVKNNGNLPDFLLFVTGKRQDAVIQTKNFHKTLQAYGAKSEMHVIPRHSHRKMALSMFNPNSEIAQRIIKVVKE
tara:strand:- start:1548 stop:2423 length:876 start_codon:yes stop_codon:yes gene_type:complete